MIRFILIGKNPSFTSTKNKTKLEYISEGLLSPLELAFGVELGLNSHSKNSEYILYVQKAYHNTNSDRYSIYLQRKRNKNHYLLSH